MMIWCYLNNLNCKKKRRTLLYRCQRPYQWSNKYNAEAFLNIDFLFAKMIIPATQGWFDFQDFDQEFQDETSQGAYVDSIYKNTLVQI